MILERTIKGDKKQYYGSISNANKNRKYSNLTLCDKADGECEVQFFERRGEEVCHYNSLNINPTLRIVRATGLELQKLCKAGFGDIVLNYLGIKQLPMIDKVLDYIEKRLELHQAKDKSDFCEVCEELNRIKGYCLQINT